MVLVFRVELRLKPVRHKLQIRVRTVEVHPEALHTIVHRRRARSRQRRPPSLRARRSHSARGVALWAAIAAARARARTRRGRTAIH